MSTGAYIPESVTRAKAAEMAEAKAEQAETKLQPGPFPIDALNETQRRIVEAVADVHELPLELAAMPALAVTAAALGKGWKLTGAVNGRENFANLYIALFAPKSSGKGAAAQIAQPIVQASSKLAQTWTETERPALETRRQVLEARAKHFTFCVARRKDGRRCLSADEMKSFEADLSQANAELGRIRPLLTAVPSFHVGNATSEALAMKFGRNADTLFALAYEGGDVLRVMLGKYNKGDNADFDLWLSGYSVEPYDSDRVLRGNVTITPCLTALIFGQPFLLRELYGNEEAFERGLTARVLPVICEPELKEDDGTEKSVPVLHRDAWHDLITRLLQAREKQPGEEQFLVVKCDLAAREVFRQFHNESIRLRNGEFKDIEGELGRWRENACRIALGLCIADDPAAVTLTEGQAQRAVKLARWGHLTALRVMQSGRMERRVARVNHLRGLAQQYGGDVKLRDLEKSHGFQPEELERLAVEFPQMFRIESKQNPKGGPVSRVLRVAQI